MRPRARSSRRDQGEPSRSRGGGGSPGGSSCGRRGEACIDTRMRKRREATECRGTARARRPSGLGVGPTAPRVCPRDGRQVRSHPSRRQARRYGSDRATEERALRRLYERVLRTLPRFGGCRGRFRGRIPCGGAPGRPAIAATWLILPVVICLSQRLSHACLSINSLYCETANGSLNQLEFI